MKNRVLLALVRFAAEAHRRSLSGVIRDLFPGDLSGYPEAYRAALESAWASRQVGVLVVPDLLLLYDNAPDGHIRGDGVAYVAITNWGVVFGVFDTREDAEGYADEFNRTNMPSDSVMLVRSTVRVAREEGHADAA